MHKLITSLCALLGVLVLVCGVWAAEATPAKEPRPLLGNEQAFMDEAFAKAFTVNAKKLKKFLRYHWGGEKAQDVIIRVEFLQPPNNMKDVKDIGQLTVTGMIETLVKWGYDPSASKLNIYCTLYRPEKGLSGKKLVRMYGQTNYISEMDSAEFMPAR